jgi:hypothetical protein
VHGYERCGVADVKRPMLEMLREGLNHHDRIPQPSSSHAVSGWLRHIVAHYAKLPERLFFAAGSTPASSSLFASQDPITRALADSDDFGIWGTAAAEMPESMRAAFCAEVWPIAKEVAKRGGHRDCPAHVTGMSDAMMYASRGRILAVPKVSWAKLASLLEGAQGKAHADMLGHAWHTMLGEPAALAKKVKHQH